MRNYSFKPVASSSKDMQPEFFLSHCLSRSTIYFSADSHLQATKYVNITNTKENLHFLSLARTLFTSDCGKEFGFLCIYLYV